MDGATDEIEAGRVWPAGLGLVLGLLGIGFGKDMELIERRLGRKNPRPLRDLSVCEGLVGFEVGAGSGVRVGDEALVVAAGTLITLASDSETVSTLRNRKR